MMDTIRPLPVISTVQVVHKLFEGGHYETDEKYLNQSRSARRSLKTAWRSQLWSRINVTKTERRLKNSWLIMNTSFL